MTACVSKCFPLQGHGAQHAGGTQRLAAGPPHRYGIVRQRLHVVAQGRRHLDGDMGFAAFEQAGGDDGRPVAVPVTADLLAVDGHFGHAVDLPQTEEPVLFGRHADRRRVGDDAGEIRRPPVLRKIEERRIFKREHRAVHLFKTDVPRGDGDGIGRGGDRLRISGVLRHLRALEDDQAGPGLLQRDAQQAVFRDVQLRPAAGLRIPAHRCSGRVEARREEVLLFRVAVDDEIEVGTGRPVLDLGHIRRRLQHLEIRIDPAVFLDGREPGGDIPRRGGHLEDPVRTGSRQVGENAPDLGVAPLVVEQADGTGRDFVHQDQLAAGGDEAPDGLRRLGHHRLDLQQHQHRVLALSDEQVPLLRATVLQEFLADIVAGVAVAVDGRPHVIGVAGIMERREGIALGTELRPEIAPGHQDGDVRAVIRMHQDRGDPRLVVRPEAEIGPEGVPFVQIGAILDPAGERRLDGRIVESVEDRMRHAGKVALVARHLDRLQGSVEDGFRIGDLLAADQPSAPGMHRGSHRFVDVRVCRPADEGVPGRSFRVPEPGFAFGDVDLHRGVDRMELASVGLDPGLEAAGVAPLVEGPQEALLHQVHAAGEEVVPRPADRVGRLRGEDRLGSAFDRVAHMADLIKDERQVRGDVVSPAGEELLGEIVAPVGAFQLHAVAEQGAEALRPPDRREEVVRHLVKEMERGVSVIVVQHRSGGAGTAVDDGLEPRHLDQGVQDMLARGDLDRHGRRAFLEGDGGSGREGVHRGRRERQGMEGDGLARIFEADLRIRFRKQLRHVEGHFRGTGQLPGGLRQQLRPLILGKELRPERPAGAHDDVAGHTAPGGGFDGGLDHRDPLRAHIVARRDAEVVPAGETDRIDLDAADAGVLHDAQFPVDFLGGQLGAVPPPADERTAFRGRIDERSVQVVQFFSGAVTARDADGSHRQ